MIALLIFIFAIIVISGVFLYMMFRDSAEDWESASLRKKKLNILIKQVEELEARVANLERGELSTNACDGLYPHPYEGEKQ